MAQWFTSYLGRELVQRNNEFGSELDEIVENKKDATDVMAASKYPSRVR